jgi:glycerate 2-kinase
MSHQRPAIGTATSDDLWGDRKPDLVGFCRIYYNRDTRCAMMNEREILEKIYWAALGAVDPGVAVSRQVDHIREKYIQGGFRRLVPLAFGKAASLMTQGLFAGLHNLLSPGIVVTKRGIPVPANMPPGLRIVEAGHPVPDHDSMAAAREVMKFAQQQGPDTMVVCLISGGGSSLLSMPSNGITLEEKRHLVDLLLKAGAEIDELNCVRKHLSAVKGGRLAALIHPAAVVSLIISDVIGDRVDVIASGPTAPDPSTFGEAYEILQKYGLAGRVPLSVVRLLKAGIQGTTAETPKKNDPAFDKVKNKVIANNSAALEAAADEALSLGFQAHILSSPIRGEARFAGRELAKKALVQDASCPVCLLSGGETTVTVCGNGIGGRNMELALGFALEIQDRLPVHLLSAGTDGDDNSTGVAGAFADGNSLMRCSTLGLDMARSLRENDSYTLFKELGDLFITGATGTNVMDIQILLLGLPPRLPPQPNTHHR